MQSEVQHHSQMHQQPPFIAPPPLGAPMVSQPGAHLVSIVQFVYYIANLHILYCNFKMS